MRLLAVGRAVEKKGFDVLLGALALLPAELFLAPDPHRRRPGTQDACGPRRPRLGLADRIDWLGPQDQMAVLGHYREADIFVLPCRVAADGDRDGLPNVLVEAQSQGLACVSTDVGGVPELIEHGVNGLLVAPDEPRRLGRGPARPDRATPTRGGAWARRAPSGSQAGSTPRPASRRWPPCCDRGVAAGPGRTTTSWRRRPNEAMTRRVLFYVQHLLGIGHLVRAGRIATALADGMDVLLVVGGELPPGLEPRNVDIFQLPPVKAGRGRLQRAGPSGWQAVRYRRQGQRAAISCSTVSTGSCPTWC